MNPSSANLELLSDGELNVLLSNLLWIPSEERTTESERLGFSASAEWRRRYPGTIAPCVFERAQEQGGFPSCYAGPRQTIEIPED